MLITSEPPHEGAQKALFTCAIYSNKNHTKNKIHTYTNLQIKSSNVRFYVHLNNWHPKHLTLTLVEGNYYITVQDFTENVSTFNVRGIMHTKGVHVTRPY